MTQLNEYPSYSERKHCYIFFSAIANLLGSIAQLIACLTADPGCKFKFQLGHIIFTEVDHEIISMVILPLVQFQEGQLSVTSKSLCTNY